MTTDAAERVELFAPEAHLRHREEQARRWLRRALVAVRETEGTGIDNTEPSTSIAASSLKKQSNGKVLHQVLAMRGCRLDQEGDGEHHQRRQHRDKSAGTEGKSQQQQQETDARMESIHGYNQSSFLDVAGKATRIPVISNTSVKEQHLRAMKKKRELHATRVQELHALLQQQQMHTKALLKQQLQDLALLNSPSDSASNAGKRHVARVDLVVETSPEDEQQLERGQVDELPQHVSPSPAAWKELQQQQGEQQQQTLHARIQERKHLEELTRQQKLAFHQQQKRTFGNIKSKRPSFLAILQLDKQRDAKQNGGTSSREKVQQQQTTPGSQERVDATESDHVQQLLQKQQKAKFVASEGIAGLHFGGGFMAKTKHTTTASARCRKRNTDP